jgi:hypothetical protein
MKDDVVTVLEAMAVLVQACHDTLLVLADRRDNHAQWIFSIHIRHNKIGAEVAENLPETKIIALYPSTINSIRCFCTKYTHMHH